VDLFRFYCKDALGLPAQPRPVDGAAAFFENYNNDKVLQDHFTLIKNMPQAVPRYGDVIVWNRKKGKVRTRQRVHSRRCYWLHLV
jgi:hypothetical protein